MAAYVEASNARTAPEEVETFVQTHTRFHASVEALANNRVLELTMQTMGQIVSHQVAVADDPRALHELLAHDHQKVASAIAAGHAKRSRTLMEEHIVGVARIYAERLRSRMTEYIEWR